MEELVGLYNQLRGELLVLPVVVRTIVTVFVSVVSVLAAGKLTFSALDRMFTTQKKGGKGRKSTKK